MARTYRVPGYEDVVFTDLLVLGVHDDDDARRLFESELSKALASNLTRARPSWELLPQSTPIGEDELDSAIGTGGFDAVLITRLVQVDEDRRYVKGRTYTKKHPRQRYYKGHYKGSYEVVHEPGYYETTSTYRFETNLYAVSEGRLVWSGHSSTVDPDSIEQGIESLTRTVAAELREEMLRR